MFERVFWQLLISFSSSMIVELGGMHSRLAVEKRILGWLGRLEKRLFGKFSSVSFNTCKEEAIYSKCGVIYFVQAMNMARNK